MTKSEISLQKTHNVPQPYYAKFIRTNVRSLNAPIFHMETDSTMSEQFNWWPSGSEQNMKCSPSYSKDSTQRNDFQQRQQFYTPSTRHGNNPFKSPSSGIVPTVSHVATPKVLQERMSFIHQYDSRKFENQQYQGKRHGAFVWTEIKPASGLRAPSGAAAFLSTERSGSPPAQQRVERGNQMTSPALVSLRHRQMLSTGAPFSEPGLKEAAGPSPRITAQERAQLGVPPTAGVDSVPSRREEGPSVSTPVAPELNLQDRAHSSHTKIRALPSATAVIGPPPAHVQVDRLVPSSACNHRHQLTPVGS
ncbi:uncharacterized protein C2orf73 homolog isoform X2 [Amia ocellicauda]